MFRTSEGNKNLFEKWIVQKWEGGLQCSIEGRETTFGSSYR